ncbi:acetyltransferase [Xenococcus sp. PCC 7305]|uniref:GNAT family N-acetyltransferase n=1 Tax=Xenococcus sp. PCC 7305 TaxID=102125 RepID=UPI0002AC9114|nr:N-acetyltransferase [Xenococcus sp. PCC 7305]ELS05338.1 acetyltransferase [Xenococcus sp. PCC 7305]
MVKWDSLSCRNSVSEDQGFLFELYASTRVEELNAWGWDAQQSSAFLKMQFQAQQASYRNQFPGCKYQIILIQGLAVGAMLVIRSETAIHLADIALLPQYRNQGIGRFLIQKLLAEATQALKPVRLQVRQSNRALRLYQRLGFSKVSEQGIHFLMEWLPSRK